MGATARSTVALVMEQPRWELESVESPAAATAKLRRLLAAGWEPFAVDQGRVYLRRRVTTPLDDEPATRRRRLSALAS
jgi:hypothetical protein